MPGKKLLVADDSLTIQKVIRLALSNEGYEIQAVADGNDALNQILLFRPDAVLIDVSLPSKNAFEVKREVNAHEDLEETRFILISSAFEKVDEAQAEEVTFHGRLTKPFDPAHLRSVLSHVLAQVTAKRMEPTSFLRRPPSVPQSSETSPLFAYPPEASPPPLPKVPASADSSRLMTPPPLMDASRLMTPPPPMEASHLMTPPPPMDSSRFMAPPPPLEASRSMPPLPTDLSRSMTSALPPTPPVDQQMDESAFFAPPPLPLSQPLESTLAPPPSIPIPPPSSEIEEDTDIQRLTESTMRITRMDDYQWSMNEPTLRPPLPHMEADGVSFKLNPESSPLSYSPGQEFDTLPPPFADPPVSEERITLDLPPMTPTPFDTEDPVAASPRPLVTEDKIDAMIHQQIEMTLGKMVEKILPQIAEKVIKEEIHRLLSE